MIDYFMNFGSIIWRQNNLFDGKNQNRINECFTDVYRINTKPLLTQMKKL